MKVTSPAFKDNVAAALGDPTLQKALKFVQGGFITKRAQAAAELPEFEALRDAARDLKTHVLGHLDLYLEAYEKKVIASGGQVHWAETAEDARRIVADICRRLGAKTVTKGKSMITEEIALNDHLEAEGFQPVETDLGEYIIQLAGETPSHIIAPAVHKTIEEVEALFAEEHGRPLETRTSADIPAMTREAREVLRQHFLSADMGITGANFLIAETGSAALVTNEGNGRMVTTLPRVHVVVTGIEKIVPTLDDFATLMRLLPRSATGQTISNYVSLLTGTKQAGDSDGPEKTVFILVDNGRANLLGSAYQEMLRCIRCGACMNHCPVYFSLGGHAYGWVYPGPMGSVLTPLYTGIENALDLPHASTGCNQCGTVCQVRIPLPGLMHRLRTEQVERGLRPLGESFALKAWAWLAGKPRLYRWVVRRAARYLQWLADDSGRIRILGLAPGWTAGRDLSVPVGKTFHEQYAARKRA